MGRQTFTTRPGNAQRQNQTRRPDLLTREFRRAICAATFGAIATVGLVGEALAQAGPATPSPTMNAIRQRGQLVCGVDTGVPGFAAQNNQGRWLGIDISYCRAIAAAVLGDAEKVRFVPTTAAARFTVLQSGEIDVLIRDSTLTFIRDVQLRLSQVAVTFYAGQGFLVRRALNVARAQDLDGATMCMVTGATLELNIADFARSTGKRIASLLFDKPDEAVAAMEAGRCDGYTDDTGSLAGMRSTLKTPNDWVVLPEVISKEPLGIHARDGDEGWRQLLFWLDAALKSAEEFGITKANVAQMRGSNDPFIRRILGVEGNYGTMLGVPDDWAAKAISAVGNYGELYEEFFGPAALNLPRGQNNLYTKGGLHYPLPFR
jgi:general L-amino acid transport system substrate-binding protein